MIVLGIDPGSVRTGYGVIKKEGGEIRHVASGLLVMPVTGKENRLVAIETELKKIIAKTKPDLAGVEKLYFTKNRKTGIEVAQARGVIIATLAKTGLSFLEIAPSQVKLAATGNGQATKEEVAKMVLITLRLPTAARLDDVTDALAVAIAALTLKRD